jgi:hypothetical protein
MQKSNKGQNAPLVYIERTDQGQKAPVNPPPAPPAQQPSGGQGDGKK